MNNTHKTEANYRLFQVFEAVHDTGNATRAAERLGLTQSAISHALRRLRGLYGDALFVRSAHGLAPTPLARDLIPRVRGALREVAGALHGHKVFEPARAKRNFRVATVDYPLMTGFTNLLSRLSREAPGVQVQIVALAYDLVDRMEAGDLDGIMAAGAAERVLFLEGGIMRSLVIDEDYVCIIRKTHPVTKLDFTIERYLEMRHIAVDAIGRPTNIVDEVLNGQGVQRQIAFTSAYFMGAAAIAAETDMIVTVPRGMATAAISILPLTILPVPISLPNASAYFWWHQGMHDDPGHRWFRSLLIEAFSAWR